MARSVALRRYNRAIIGLSLAYAAALIGANMVFKGNAPTGPLAYSIAILPALPIIGMFGAIGRYLSEEQDEYVRLLAVRQTLIASAFALSIATAWGFLESFDVVGHVDSYYIAVLWFGGLGVGACVNQFAPAGRAA
ncbi:MAG: hypothetical protein K2P68_10070 [Sphingomonas sp.]|nr:hypothetical protein [Sphingomonas sp.]